MHYACCAASAVLSSSPVLFCPVQPVHLCVFVSKIRFENKFAILFDSDLHFLFFARLRGWAAEEKEEDDEDEEEELGIFRGGVLRMEGVQMWGGWGEMGSSGWVGADEWKPRCRDRGFLDLVVGNFRGRGTLRQDPSSDDLGKAKRRFFWPGVVDSVFCVPSCQFLWYTFGIEFW